MKLILSTLLILAAGCSTKPIAPLPTIIQVGPPMPQGIKQQSAVRALPSTVQTLTLPEPLEVAPITISAAPWPRIQFEGVPAGNWRIWKSVDLKEWIEVLAIEQRMPGQIILFDIVGDQSGYYKLTQ